MVTVTPMWLALCVGLSVIALSSTATTTACEYKTRAWEFKVKHASAPAFIRKKAPSTGNDYCKKECDKYANCYFAYNQLETTGAECYLFTKTAHAQFLAATGTLIDLAPTAGQMGFEKKVENCVVSDSTAAVTAPPPKLEDCNGTFVGLKAGKLASPGYPNKYPANQMCGNLIIVPDGYRIRLWFNSLETEKSNTCGFDYVKVFDGKNEKATLKGKYCGKVDPAPHLESTGNHMFVAFRSDASAEAKGFQAFFEAIKSGSGSTGGGSTGGGVTIPPGGVIPGATALSLCSPRTKLTGSEDPFAVLSFPYANFQSMVPVLKTMSTAAQKVICQSTTSALCPNYMNFVYNQAQQVMAFCCKEGQSAAMKNARECLVENPSMGARLAVGRCRHALITRTKLTQPQLCAAPQGYTDCLKLALDAYCTRAQIADSVKIVTGMLAPFKQMMCSALVLNPFANAFGR